MEIWNMDRGFLFSGLAGAFFIYKKKKKKIEIPSRQTERATPKTP